MLSEWTLSVDGALNVKESGTVIILEGPGDIVVKQELEFEFKTRNNQDEYEALIPVMVFILERDASKLKEKSDSQLVAYQFFGECQGKEPQLIKYLSKVQNL